MSTTGESPAHPEPAEPKLEKGEMEQLGPIEAEEFEPAEEDEEESSQADVWDEEPLQRRPRRRLLTPLTALLFVLLVGAGGFIAGVLVEKGEVPTAGAAVGGGGRLAALRGGTGSPVAERGGAGSPFAGRSGTVGQVANISGSNLYVTELQGNTIKVATAAAQITKQVSTSVKGIHPGDTVIVQGAHASDGSIQASTVQDSGSSGAFGAGSRSSSSSNNSGTGGGEQALFGK